MKSAEDRLREIKERCEKATPGAWTLWLHAAPPNKPSCIYGDGRESVLCVREPGDEQAYLVISKNDEAFILQSREDIPWLLARDSEHAAALAKAEERCRVLEEALRKLAVLAGRLADAIIDEAGTSVSVDDQWAISNGFRLTEGCAAL